MIFLDKEIGKLRSILFYGIISSPQFKKKEKEMCDHNICLQLANNHYFFMDSCLSNFHMSEGNLNHEQKLVMFLKTLTINLYIYIPMKLFAEEYF